MFVHCSLHTARSIKVMFVLEEWRKLHLLRICAIYSWCVWASSIQLYSTTSHPPSSQTEIHFQLDQRVNYIPAPAHSRSELPYIPLHPHLLCSSPSLHPLSPRGAARPLMSPFRYSAFWETTACQTHFLWWLTPKDSQFGLRYWKWSKNVTEVSESPCAFC